MEPINPVRRAHCESEAKKLVVQSSALTYVWKEVGFILQVCLTAIARAESDKSWADLPLTSTEPLKRPFSQKCLISLEIVCQGSLEE